MFDHCLYFNTTSLARVVEREWTKAFKPFGVTPSQGFLLGLGLIERRAAEHDGRHWSVFPTRKATGMEDALNAASGTVTRRIQQLVGRDNFQETVGKVRAVCSALK